MSGRKAARSSPTPGTSVVDPEIAWKPGDRSKSLENAVLPQSVSGRIEAAVTEHVGQGFQLILAFHFIINKYYISRATDTQPRII